ncbi:hypothetical protein PYW08_014772 [Mythimna loreyi]|uniref:Uncharacterized protein n=1 Tax=Mythimna loreyi TaxID=667449 RepID=A0ACC2R3D0_9NEOP|nr:hypothetical protein PYW08_014772 [Mythimna loreyi]
MDRITITDLPEELIILIARLLDFPSLCSMYNSCILFRNILSLQGVISECHMSANLAATADTLKLHFFKDISSHLLVLNMRGVHDLTKTKVLPAFRKLKRLKVLDISYTNLNIPDLMAIHSACPTVTDITIDYRFERGCVTVTEEALEHFQSVFVHFENVHFVGSVHNLLSSNLALHILKESRLSKLQFTVVEVNNPPTTVIKKNYADCPIPHFSHFAAYIIVNRRIRGLGETPNYFPFISQIQLEKEYEFCAIYTLRKHMCSPSVYATPLFKEFFCEHFNISIQNKEEYDRKVKGNVAFLVWSKETTQFDDKFFQNLYSQVKPYFPIYYKTPSDVTCPQNYDWIFINPTLDEINSESDAPQEKKRKTLLPNVEFDYDNLLKDKHKVQLSINFPPDHIMSASLPSKGQYFSKITFLSLCGAIKYNRNFFLNLFQWCHNLVTLSIELPVIISGRYANNILHALQVSQSMKNLRLVVKGINFKQSFYLLSKCRNLENIFLIDPKQWYHSEIADPTSLIQSCAKLYNVFIEAPFSAKALTKQLQLFKYLKEYFERPHMRVVINRVTDDTCLYGYDPFTAVFKLYSIKPI